MTILTEGPHAGAFIVSEAANTRSRETVTIESGQDLDAGTVIGALTRDTVDVAADVGNTGAAVVTATTVTLGDQSEAGVYTLTCTTAGSSGGGDFQVQTPSGALLAPITAGSAYAGDHISLTLPEGDGAGTADWAVDDVVTITVSGSGKYTQFDQDGTDGSQIAAGVVVYPIDATAADTEAAAIVRDAEVNGDELTWPSDIEVGEKTTAIAQLATLGIIVR
jgi:hypothetical protein